MVLRGFLTNCIESIMKAIQVLLPAGWSTSGYPVTSNANGTNSITITPPTGNLFFRLFQ
jgi:hypothetical protein